MEVVQAIGWMGAVFLIGSYFCSARMKDPMIFHMANVLAALLLIPSQIYLGVWFGAFISLSFGLIAAYAIWKEKNVTYLKAGKHEICVNVVGAGNRLQHHSTDVK